MSARLRLADTGLLPARRNIAITAALAELHAAGEMLDTLRFQRFERCVLLGRNQDFRTAVRIDRCRARGIALARRVTGGGAVYMDPGVLSWEIVADRRRFGQDLSEAAAGICRAVAEALARFGVAAEFVPPNAVIVGGQKLGGASGYFEGATLVHEGTVLVDVSVAEMAAVLHVPKPESIAARVTSLNTLLGSTPSMADLQRGISVSISNRFDFCLEEEALSAREQALADRLCQSEFGTDAFVFGEEGSGHRSRVSGQARVPA